MANPFDTATPAGGTASPFGATAPTTTTTASGPNGAEAPNLDAPVEQPIDPNDPRLTSEALTVAEGDAFATPPPPPDQRWRVKLKHEGIKKENSNEVIPWEGAWQKDRTGSNIAMYARTVVSVTIQDPQGKHDGLRLGVPFKFMDTKPNREGVSKVTTILNLLRRPSGQPWISVGEKLNHRALIERFIEALQSEPEVFADSTWEVTCDVCQAEAKKNNAFAKSVQGMNKFNPSRTVAKAYDPDYECRVNRGHGYSRARAMATHFSAIK